MTRRRALLLLLVAGLLGSLAVFAFGAGAAEQPTHGGETHGRALAVFEAPPHLHDAGVVPPALWLFGAALLLPWLPRPLRSLVAVAAPAVALWSVATQVQPGLIVTTPFLEYSLQLVRADRLSIAFGMIFSLVGVIAGIYAWHNDDRRQQVAALLYNAGALGVTFAGDTFTLYAAWELMAIASTVLIWARGVPASARAGGRYILVHLTGGSILLGGILLHLQQTGSIAFNHFAPGEGGMAAWLMLIGFAINAAVFPLGAWLPDAYPRATITGAVFCSALTTKTAVYVLLRGFYGWDVLIAAGVVMALVGVVYALLVNDIRAILAYGIVSQVGYMVAGIGLGTELALNGAVAHAVCHILYKAMLFMAAGAVIHTTGREKLTELGGLFSQQKLLFGLYAIGALSIAGFPGFNGFISKSMVTAAAHEAHANAMFLGLMLAAVGTFVYTGLRLPYGVWMGEDRGLRAQPMPVNMTVALVLGAFFCTLLGVVPDLLYRYLPFAVEWRPYTASHLAEMLPLLVFAFFAWFLFRGNLAGTPTTTVDTDVLYRKPAPLARLVFVTAVGAFFDRVQQWGLAAAARVQTWLADPSDWLPGGLPRVPTDEPGYDEDRNRRPMGVSLALTLLGFVIVAVWTLVEGQKP